MNSAKVSGTLLLDAKVDIVEVGVARFFMTLVSKDDHPRPAVLHVRSALSGCVQVMVYVELIPIRREEELVLIPQVDAGCE